MEENRNIIEAVRSFASTTRELWSQKYEKVIGDSVMIFWAGEILAGIARKTNATEITNKITMREGDVWEFSLRRVDQ